MHELCEKGLKVLDASSLPEHLENSVIIIRAHGVGPDVEADLKRRGAALIDATCPKVKANQNKARAISEAGRPLFIAGEAGHAEVAGLRAYAPGAIVVGNEKEIDTLAINNANHTNVSKHEFALFAVKNSSMIKPALLAQTTFSDSELCRIADALRTRFPELEALDSICPATRERQCSLRELCGQCEAVVIAGGRASANTRRLLAIAEKLGKPARLVESAAELAEELGRYSTIGLAAGASTPDWVIDEVEKALLAQNSRVKARPRRQSPPIRRV
jgi:4-hydroxy-3-methylbut-2-enyl diphosphate reductase